MTAPFAIETERLVLRDWRDGDLPAHFAMCSDPRVMEFLGGIAKEEDCASGIARQRASQSAHGHCFWAVERKEDGALIGFCGLKSGMANTPIEGKMEIGWRLRADAWGQGYAREAAQASLHWGWAHLDDASIWAITVPPNVRSWGLMQRLGMTRHPELDFDMAMPNGGPAMPHITYSIGRPA